MGIARLGKLPPDHGRTPKLLERWRLAPACPTSKQRPDLTRAGVQAEVTEHLYDVMFFLQLLESLPLGQFEQRHLGRNEPAEEIAEHDVVAEGDDVLNLPKYRPVRSFG